MAIDLLREGYSDRLSARDRELVEAAAEEARRLRALIADLLDLSRIESGRIEMEIAAHDAAELLAQAAGAMQKQADERQISFEMVPPERPLAVRADGNKIVWVLTNLLVNALNHTPVGGRVSLAATAGAGVVYFAVSDNGAGIPREYHARIFDKFVRVPGDPAPGGTGLGLAICREIVRALGGTIWVESEPGAGSKFTFSLPAAR
jgi:NtrC-family two-component system sensor histidine kinase KinB